MAEMISTRTRKGAWATALLAGAGLLVAAGLVFAAAPDKDWPVPPSAAQTKNPVAATEANIAAGKAIFMDKCVKCHGEKGAGDGPMAMMYDPPPADLSEPKMMNSMPDGEIFYKIAEGRAPMPSFKKLLTDEQRWQLVDYVRTLAPKPAPPSKSGSTGKSPRAASH